MVFFVWGEFSTFVVEGEPLTIVLGFQVLGEIPCLLELFGRTRYLVFMVSSFTFGSQAARENAAAHETSRPPQPC
jgi:hypothetical protein